MEQRAIQSALFFCSCSVLQIRSRFLLEEPFEGLSLVLFFEISLVSWKSEVGQDWQPSRTWSLLTEWHFTASHIFLSWSVDGPWLFLILQPLLCCSWGQASAKCFFSLLVVPWFYITIPVCTEHVQIPHLVSGFCSNSSLLWLQSEPSSACWFLALGFVVQTSVR